MQNSVRALFVLAVSAALLAGCESEVQFPTRPTGESPARALRMFDLDDDGDNDYFAELNPEGRIHRIGYDTDADGEPDDWVDLDEIPVEQSRHLVIILDGFAHEVVEDYYRDGGLRLLHPPRRVVSPYPTMTDIALTAALDLPRVSGFEAKYYSHEKGKVVGGSMAYLGGENSPYNDPLDYRAPLLWDAIQYVKPWHIFGKELNGIKKGFDKSEKKEFLAYIVSSAGVGTRESAAGQRKALDRLDQLIQQVVMESRGRVKVTMFSDHGHSYTAGERAPIGDCLKKNGWTLTERPRKPRDVAWVRFGLVTFAAFATDSPAALARDLATCRGVELATYRASRPDRVMVLSPKNGSAAIRKIGDRYAYEPVDGDPLHLLPILRDLDPEGGPWDADALLEATSRHLYPTPLQRLWRAHHDLVKDPADVTVSLGDAWYSGAGGFSNTIDVASTHGSLNRRNSVTFIASSVAPLPELMRSRDLANALSEALKRPFPLKKTK